MGLFALAFALGIWLMLGRAALGLIDRIDAVMDRWDKKGAS